MLVYGRNVALEVLKKPKNVQKVLLQDGFDDKKILTLLEKSKIPVFIKPKKEIDHLAEGVHQGIILYVRDYQYYPLADIVNEDASFLVILDHLEDPHNFGAIIRTCEAAGVDGIIIPKDRQVQVNATVMKTSVGTLDTMKVSQVANLSSTIDYLKKNDFWVVGTALEDSVDYRSIDYSGKIALVIGNEGVGISNLVRKKCDFIAKIPMYGTTNSLNASVASGIMIYEVIRNRK
ncbi:MAG: 23S rRNA (guanosine(2251)-2'-O)-methyltransferase RlmB [Bacilli bacterium]|nr:23S rRNA (guanosine(2251)-2'-O)-methyltransferase RlmB [Bacilli bacterium]